MAADPLVDLFCRLAATPSPSGYERRCADIAIAYLNDLGLVVDEDDAGHTLGGDAGNLYCQIAPTVRDGIPLFFCAHLDTVPADGPISPVERDHYLVNAASTILGADNKAAIAVMLDAVRTVIERGVEHAGLELVLTVREEQGLRGAKVFDIDRLHATTGYVYDHAAPIGGMVLAAPSRTTIEVEVTGRAAHAGIYPEDGCNAIVAAAAALTRIEHGRVDAATTVNVGLIHGGSSINVVADRCAISLEVRSLDDALCHTCVDTVVAIFHDAAQAHGCKASPRIRDEYHAYRLDEGAVPVRLARAALRRCGIEPETLETGGGADAHVFCAAGRACLNLSHGVERIHSREERVRVADLHTMKEVTLALIAQAATGGASQ